jgi:trigger factor
MTTDRDEISSHMRRKVRQCDGFGCVVCGAPLYDYEHFDEYAKVREHSIENIYLACLSHHRKKGTLYSKELIATARRAPKNRQTPWSKPEQLGFAEGPYTLKMASSLLHVQDGRPAAALVVQGQPLLAFKPVEPGVILLDLLLQDPSGRHSSGFLTVSCRSMPLPTGILNGILPRRSTYGAVLEMSRCA